MTIIEAIALEHATLLRVFDQAERVLPGLRSAAELGTLATILEEQVSQISCRILDSAGSSR